MIDRTGQPPAPGAAAWLVDLSEIRGPLLVVLRSDEWSALDAAVAHLVGLGTVGDEAAAHNLIAEGDWQPVGVVW